MSDILTVGQIREKLIYVYETCGILKPCYIRKPIQNAINYISLLEAENATLREKEVSTIPCCDCGGDVVEFSIPNDIWNFVNRPDGHETDKEYLCINCWEKALRKKLSLPQPPEAKGE